MKQKIISHGIIAGLIATTMSGSAASSLELKLADFLPPTHPYQEQVYGVLATRLPLLQTAKSHSRCSRAGHWAATRPNSMTGR